MPRDIAFGCEARVGKDTACEYILRKYGEGVRVSIAEPLYQIMYYAQKVCGFKQEKDRTFLQWVGTDWARAKEPDVWARLLSEAITANRLSHVRSIITDLRFKNEFQMLREREFLLVRLVRGAAQDMLRAEAGPSFAKHPSEGALVDADWDIIIHNDGSLEELYAKLDRLVQGDYPQGERPVHL